VREIATVCLLGAIALASCKDRPASSPEEIVTRGWRAHELVIAAGERAPTCAEAGLAMQRVYVEHRRDFIDAVALDNDRERLRRATDYLEAHERDYADLETRMEALEQRCADDPNVAATFRAMDRP
jgi:hypothetical protein